MIVVDTNVIAYLLLRGDHSEASERLYKVDPDWVAPRLWSDEFLNVLCTYERNGLLDAQDAANILADSLLLMDGKSYDIPPHRTLSTARRSGCSGYDSQYIALAEELGIKLYTHNKRILVACPGLAVTPS